MVNSLVTRRRWQKEGNKLHWNLLPKLAPVPEEQYGTSNEVRRGMGATENKWVAFVSTRLLWPTTIEFYGNYVQDVNAWRLVSELMSPEYVEDGEKWQLVFGKTFFAGILNIL